MNTAIDFASVNAPVSPTDRLMITIILAALVHALIILGVGFEIPKPIRINKSLEIALVIAPKQKAPKEADFLSQDNQEGSGKSLEKVEPVRRQAPVSGREGLSSTQAPVAHRVVSKPKRVITQRKSRTKIVTADQPTPELDKNKQPLTSMGLSQQIAELGAEIVRVQNDIAKRPRIKFINSVNAHKYKAAAYEKAWQHKVERVGNLNYPDEARRRKLSGSLLLAVGVGRDGSIYSIKVRRSSGHKALDDGAVRIVRLSGPFAPFPKDLADDADVLVITRTWKFFDDSHLTTSGY